MCPQTNRRRRTAWHNKGTMASPRSILFVCTGNIYRSLSAEKFFKQYLDREGIKNWRVGSAGVAVEAVAMYPKLARTLQSYGIEDLSHRQRQITRAMLERYDIVVGMARNHLDYLRGDFGYKGALLFNELALGEETSVFDINEVVPNYPANRAAIDANIEQTLKHLHESIPKIFKNASDRFYLFEDFITGARTHRNGYPFIPLHETPNTVAFMSIDIPRHGDGHVLVVPKKRYPDFSHVPPEILRELIEAVSAVSRAVGAHSDGYNLLLNNGPAAGQSIFHAHFHVVPRRRGDGLQFEGWQRAPLSVDEFVALNEKVKQQISRV